MRNRKPSAAEASIDLRAYCRDISRFARAALTATLMTYEDEDHAIDKAFQIAEKCSKKSRTYRKRKKHVDKLGDDG